MPYGDRRWPLMLAGTLALFAMAGSMVMSNTDSIESGRPQFLAILLCVAGLIALYGTMKARQRYLLRVEAMQGNQDVMWPADVQASNDTLPDLAKGSLEISWQASPAVRFLYSFMLVLMCAMCGFVALSAIKAGARPGTNPRILGWPVQVSSEQVLAVAVLAFIIWAVLFRGPDALGWVTTVSVSHDGVREHRGPSREHFVPWDDMKLIEYMQIQQKGPVRPRPLVIVNGTNDVVLIELEPLRVGDYVPIGATRADAADRMVQIISLIITRTGLIPRTLSPILRKPNFPE